MERTHTTHKISFMFVDEHITLNKVVFLLLLLQKSLFLRYDYLTKHYTHLQTKASP
jgi:hypothetical protein